jgi:hypothetical protein
VGALALAALSCRQGERDLRSIDTGWADSKTIKLARDASRTSATLNFRTTKLIQCELRLWAADPVMQPTRESPTTRACAGGNGLAITETFENLRTDSYYIVQVDMWMADSPGEKKRFTVEEGAREGGIVNDVGGASRYVNNLVVARVDLPTRAMEIHGVALEEKSTIARLRDSLTRPTGCRAVEAFESSKFSEGKSSLPMRGLATRGYATSAMFQHPSDESRLQGSFPWNQPGAKWEWMFSTGKDDVSFFSMEPPRFKTLEAQAGEVFRFPDGGRLDLLETQAGTIPAGRPLRLTWSLETPMIGARVVARLGNASQGNAVECAFEAALGTGTIEASAMSSLQVGSVPLQVDLEAPQIQVFPGTARPVWLIVSHDWRRVEMRKF